MASSPTIIELVTSYTLYYFKDIILNAKLNDEDIRMVVRYKMTAQTIEKGIKHIRSLIIKKNKQSESPAFNINFLSPEKSVMGKTEDNGMKEEDEVIKKINEAAEFLRKIEENEIKDEDIDATQMENLDKYLDLIISENEKSLN